MMVTFSAVLETGGNHNHGAKVSSGTFVLDPSECLRSRCCEASCRVHEALRGVSRTGAICSQNYSLATLSRVTSGVGALDAHMHAPLCMGKTNHRS